jgi:hypothetical protein
MATRKTSSKKANKARSAAATKTKSKVGITRATAGARKPGLHALIGRAVADAEFLGELLAAPEATVSQFSLDAATRREVLALLANPNAVRRNVSAFVRRFRRRPSVEAV